VSSRRLSAPLPPCPPEQGNTGHRRSWPPPCDQELAVALTPLASWPVPPERKTSPFLAIPWVGGQAGRLAGRLSHGRWGQMSPDSAPRRRISEPYAADCPGFQAGTPAARRGFFESSLCLTSTQSYTRLSLAVHQVPCSVACILARPRGCSRIWKAGCQAGCQAALSRGSKENAMQ
jgi:hypothetical protein